MKKSLVISAFVSLSFLFLFSIQAIAGDPDVNCNTQPVGFDSNENPNSNRREPGKWMKWKIIGPDNTWVEFDFTDQKTGATATGSPFQDGQDKFTVTIENNGEKVKRGPVAATAAGLYGYKITCHLPDGTVNVVDPIIEVPRITVPPPPESKSKD